MHFLFLLLSIFLSDYFILSNKMYLLFRNDVIEIYWSNLSLTCFFIHSFLALFNFLLSVIFDFAIEIHYLSLLSVLHIIRGQYGVVHNFVFDVNFSITRGYFIFLIYFVHYNFNFVVNTYIPVSFEFLKRVMCGCICYWLY